MNVYIGSRQLISSVLDSRCLSTDERRDARSGEGPRSQPVRGLCPCGHLMSMHCYADGSGPCAAPDCRCPGQSGG